MANDYAVQAGWRRLTSKTTTHYAEDGTPSLTATENYEYDENTYQVEQTTETTSNGLERTTEHRFAFEQYPVMSDANMMVQRYSTTVKDETDAPVAKQWTTWSDASGDWRPDAEWVWIGDGTGDDTSVDDGPGDSCDQTGEVICQVDYVEYDPYGQVLKQDDARDKRVSFTYDAASLLLEGVSKGGLSVSYTYYTGAYDSRWGLLKSIAGPGGNATRYDYDGLRRLSKVSNDAGAPVSSYAYRYTSGDPGTDPSYVKTTLHGGIKNPNQVSTKYVDGLGRLHQTRVEAGAEDVVTAQTYDAAGRKHMAYRPYWQSGSGYDADFDTHATAYYQNRGVAGAGRPFSEVLYRDDPLGRVAKVYPSGESSAAARTNYDVGTLDGNAYLITDQIDEVGDVIRTYTDGFGRTVATIADPGGANARTMFTYDLQDNLTQVERPQGDQVTYTYDRAGRLVERESPDAGLARRAYDAAGNLRFRQDAEEAKNGNVWFTAYDALGRPTVSGEVPLSDLDGATTFTDLHPDATYAAEEDTTRWHHVRVYDAAPDASAYPWRLFDFGAVAFDNARGQIAAEAYRSGVTEESPGAWQVSFYSYDAESRPKEKHVFTQGHSLLGASIRYEYDRQGRLIERNTTVGGEAYSQWYTYNRRGLVEAVYASRSTAQPALPEVTYRYAPDEQVEEMEFRGLEPVTYAQTIRGWTDEVDGIRSPDQLFAANYSYFADGNVDRATFRQPGLSGASTRYRYVHTYDGLGRLTDADYSYYNSGWQSSAAYDVTAHYADNGNIRTLSRYGEGGSLVDDLDFTYADSVAGGNNSPNRLKKLTDAAGALHGWDAGSGSFGYDEAGRMTASPGPYSLTAADYDERNLPTSLTTASGTSRYRYSASGKRYYKQVGTDPAQHYVLDGGATLGLFDASFDNLDVFVEEEQSSNSETAHTTEAVGYVVFGAPGAVDGAVGEVGTVYSDQPDRSTWHVVQFERSYTNPVAFAQVASYEGKSPAHVRLRSVAGGGFEWQIEEWEYQDGPHARESVGYSVFEAGARELSDGTRIEVGTASTDEGWTSVTFSQPFSVAPIVLAQSQTINGGQSAVTRLRNVTSSGFEVRMQEEEELDAAGGHAVEVIGYLAIAPGTGAAGVAFEAGRTANAVKGADDSGNPLWHRITLETPFPRPVVFAAMQTADGRDTAAVRHRIHPLPRYWNLLLPSGEVVGRIPVQP